MDVSISLPISPGSKQIAGLLPVAEGQKRLLEKTLEVIKTKLDDQQEFLDHTHLILIWENLGLDRAMIDANIQLAKEYFFLYVDEAFKVSIKDFLQWWILDPIIFPPKNMFYKNVGCNHVIQYIDYAGAEYSAFCDECFRSSLRNDPFSFHCKACTYDLCIHCFRRRKEHSLVLRIYDSIDQIGIDNSNYVEDEDISKNEKQWSPIVFFSGLRDHKKDHTFEYKNTGVCALQLYDAKYINKQLILRSVNNKDNLQDKIIVIELAYSMKNDENQYFFVSGICNQARDFGIKGIIVVRSNANIYIYDHQDIKKFSRSIGYSSIIPVVMIYSVEHGKRLIDRLKQNDFLTGEIFCTDDPNKMSHYYPSNQDKREISIRVHLENIFSIDTVKQVFDASIIIHTAIKCTKREKSNYEFHQRFQSSTFASKKDYDPLEQWNDRCDYEIRVRNMEKCEEEKVVNEAVYQWKALYNCKSYYLRGTFREYFELQNFPLDVQDLTFNIVCANNIKSAVLKPQEFVDKFIIIDRDDIGIPEWKVFGVTSEFDATKAESDHGNVGFSRFRLKVKVKREFMAFVWRIVFPILIITITPLSAYSMDIVDHADRLNYVVTLFLTLVAFLFLISTMVPNLPYLTILDNYILFGFAYIFLINLQLIIQGQLVDENYSTSNVTNSIIDIIIWIIVNIGFGYYCYRIRKEEMKKLSMTSKQFEVKYEQNLNKDPLVIENQWMPKSFYAKSG